MISQKFSHHLHRMRSILNMTYLDKLRSIVLSFTKLDPSLSEVSKSKISSDGIVPSEVELPPPISLSSWKIVKLQTGWRHTVGSSDLLHVKISMWALLCLVAPDRGCVNLWGLLMHLANQNWAASVLVVQWLISHWWGLDLSPSWNKRPANSSCSLN